MPNLMSIEDLFYGVPEPTWILPTRDATPPRYLYKEREFLEHPRRPYKPEPPRPVVHHNPRAPVQQDIRPIERLARVHTVPEPVPVATQEEIRKVVEVPTAVPITAPVPIVEPHPPVVTKEIIPPIQRPLIHHPIELRVPMCCEKCTKKVRDRLEDLEGVENVVTDQYNQKVVVYGHVDPARVLNRVKLVKKRSEYWDMTVDYSDEYRRARQAQAEAARAETARAEAIKAQTHAKALVAPTSVTEPPRVVVNLPREHNGPKVTAILPAERESAMPYVANPRHHSERYVSPLRASRREMFAEPRRGMRRPEFYSDRHPDAYTVY